MKSKIEQIEELKLLIRYYKYYLKKFESIGFSQIVNSHAEEIKKRRVELEL